MTTDFERGVRAALGVIASLPLDATFSQSDIERRVLALLPPASIGAGGDAPYPDLTDDQMAALRELLGPENDPQRVRRIISALPDPAPASAVAYAERERTRFEAYAKRQGYDTKRLNGGIGDYDSVALHMAWAGWKWKARALAADAQKGGAK